MIHNKRKQENLNDSIIVAYFDVKFAIYNYPIVKVEHNIIGIIPFNLFNYKTTEKQKWENF